MRLIENYCQEIMEISITLIDSIHFIYLYFVLIYIQKNVFKVKLIVNINYFVVETHKTLMTKFTVLTFNVSLMLFRI